MKANKSSNIDTKAFSSQELLLKDSTQVAKTSAVSPNPRKRPDANTTNVEKKNSMYLTNTFMASGLFKKARAHS